MPVDPFSLLCIFATVFILGLAKGGFSGIVMLATPIMALVFPPVQAAAIILPLLVVQDAFSVWTFRHSWNKKIVAWMAPGALLGITLAAFTASRVSHDVITGALGVISILFGLWRLKLLWARNVESLHGPDWMGFLFGMGSGFTSQIAHAGSPPFQIWVSPKRLPHAEYVGTSSILFAIINWAKVPAFWALGAFTRETLYIAMLLLPFAILATFFGIWMVRRMDSSRYYTAIDLLLIALGVKLLWDAIY